MAIERINKILNNLIISSKPETSPCFLHEILYRLNFIERKQSKNLQDEYFETLAVDNQGNLYYNPDFIQNLSNSELYGALLHETMHLAFFHFDRMKNKDIEKWNYATDLVINNILINNGFTLPQELLVLKIPNDITEEKLYDTLPNSENKIKNHNFWQTNTTEKVSELIKSAKNQILIKQTVSSLDNFLIKQHESKTEIDWTEMLKDFLIPICQSYKYNYSKQSIIGEMMAQQRPHESTFLPRLQTNNLKDDNILIVIDTSGSTVEVLDCFYSEVSKIIKQLDIQLNVICCDDGVKSFFQLSKANFTKNQSFIGGGGTDFSPPFNYVQENKIDVSALIYITDGWGECNIKEPNYPVLWLSTDRLNFCSFGKFVKLKI